jgi:hypothetical protein
MQMKNILAAAGLGRPVEAGESLADFVARLAADGAPVDIAPGIVSGLIWEKPGKNGQVRRRTYRSLTYLEFNDLKDAIDNLKTLGERQQQVRVRGQLMRADLLDGLGLTPEAWGEDGTDVTPETRSDFERRMVEAGRSQTEAGRETEFASRLASTLSRTTGTDPNMMLRERVAFRKAGMDEAGGGFHQPPTPEQVKAADEALAEDVAAWGKSVDDFVAGTLRETKQVTMLRHTPLVLQMVGAKNRRMMVNIGKLKEILATKHKLPVETLKQVPAAMTDPIMIFKSASEGGDLVMMLDLKDQHGATVIVPLLLEVKGSSGYTVNIVKSIYSKKDENTLRPSDQWFANQIAQGNLIYRNNKKSREWAGSVGLQLPPGGTPSNATRNKIYNYKDFVKYREGHPGFYQAAHQAQEAGPRGGLEILPYQSSRVVFTEAAGAKRDGGRI